jgi:hypothetical protein
MEQCIHPSCSERFRESMYLPYCSEYCHIIRKQLILGHKPILQRDCNWCGITYEYRYGSRLSQVSFCGTDCSRAAQGIRKYYAIINILKINCDEKLGAMDIARMGGMHGAPMNYNKAAMRLRTLTAKNIVLSEEGEGLTGLSPHKHLKYFLNPELVGVPMKDSLKCLDKFRKPHRRDKIRARKAAAKRMM